MFKVFLQLPGALISAPALLGQGLENDGLQLIVNRALARAHVPGGAFGDARIRRPLPAGRRGRGFGDVFEHLGHVPRDRIRIMTREYLVENDAQRINVGARVDIVRVSAGLFGRHVGQRADDVLRHGNHRVDRSGKLFGQSEIEDFGAALRINQNVGRLEIPVNDAFLVRVLHGIANL